MRIVSYNIRKARGFDQRRNPGRILDVINSLQGDIVVLQEADKRLGPRRAALPRAFVEANSDYTVAPVAQNDVSLGWHGNAVLLRDGFRARCIRHLALPGLEPRGAVRLDIDGRVAFSLVATHLGLRRRDRRAQQAVINAAVPASARAVVAGDFNEWSQKKGLEPFADRFSVFGPGRSYPARSRLAALDRFALSPGVVLKDAGVEAGALAKRASDHLPIWGELAFVAMPEDVATQYSKAKDLAH